MPIRFEPESDRQTALTTPAASRSALSARVEVRCEGMLPRASSTSGRGDERSM
jgi:hypothetical protein